MLLLLQGGQYSGVEGDRGDEVFASGRLRSGAEIEAAGRMEAHMDGLVTRLFAREPSLAAVRPTDAASMASVVGLTDIAGLREDLTEYCEACRQTRAELPELPYRFATALRNGVARAQLRQQQ